MQVFRWQDRENCGPASKPLRRVSYWASHVTTVLSNLKPTLGTVDNRFGSLPRDSATRHRMRDDSQSHRRWYKTARWQKLRWLVLVRDNFTCKLCENVLADTSKLVADHIKEHKGDERLFWNEDNLQSLCKRCHDSEKQSIERSGRKASFHPKWMRPSQIPLTIVCGPPASGKSTFVSSVASADDLVIDVDAIAAQMSGQSTHSWDRRRWLNPALRQRNEMLGSLSRRPQHNAAWFIVSEPRAANRGWWVRKIKPVNVIVLEVAEPLCLEFASARQRQKFGHHSTRRLAMVVDLSTAAGRRHPRRPATRHSAVLSRLNAGGGSNPKIGRKLDPRGYSFTHFFSCLGISAKNGNEGKKPRRPTGVQSDCGEAGESREAGRLWHVAG